MASVRVASYACMGNPSGDEFPQAVTSRGDVSSRLLLTLLAMVVCVCSVTATFAFNAGFSTGLKSASSTIPFHAEGGNHGVDALTVLAQQPLPLQARQPLLSLSPQQRQQSQQPQRQLLSPQQRQQPQQPQQVDEPTEEDRAFSGLLARMLKQEDKPLDSGHEDLPEGWPCKTGESLFMNMCYVDCGKATQGKFPFRDDPCTCCNSFPCDKRPGHYSQDCVKLDKSIDGRDAEGPRLLNCRSEFEELYEGLCYLRCDILTAQKYPIRTGMNTCSNELYGGNWMMGLGPCSGFGVGGRECMPNIPLPLGLGVPEKKRVTAEDFGVPPLGIRVPPPVQAVSQLSNALASEAA